MLNELWLGQAGSGKSTAIAALKQGDKAIRTLVLCPTGVAAWNLNTTTINSYFSLGIGDLPLKECLARFKHKKDLQKIDAIVIDECFTLSEFQMDMMVKMTTSCGQLPKFILVGDPAQLLSVDKPFISASCAVELMTHISKLEPGMELVLNSTVAEPVSCTFYSMNWKVRHFAEQYRQDNTYFHFCQLFRGTTASAFDMLTESISLFSPVPHLDAPTVFYTNDEVNKFNVQSLEDFPGKPVTIYRNLKYLKIETGDDSHNNIFKVGCPIMLLRNRDISKGQCNGSVMKFSAFDNGILTCEDSKGEQHVIYSYPYFKLSFAMTIHKVQGLTLEKINIKLADRYKSAGDVNRLIYVALTRVRDFNSIHLAS